MYYYKHKNKVLVSTKKHNGLKSISEAEAIAESQEIFWLSQSDPEISRRSFLATDSSLLFTDLEGPSLLQCSNDQSHKIPEWLNEKVQHKKVCVINTRYSKWEDVLTSSHTGKWRINVAGLGDVGGILITGLRLLGGDAIEEIGIFDLDENKTNRWLYEVNQIIPPDGNIPMPQIKNIKSDDIFDCDMFVFCVSLGVPPVGGEHKDVRMAQFDGNSKIISSYAQNARKAGFKGIFAVVSDPVDHLCKSAFISSNLGDEGIFDSLGLAPEQVRGYGLGVMNARASFIASHDSRFTHFLQEGRVFGPHGEGLIVADSIENYNPELSNILTEGTKTANLEVRRTGFKPYIAPALSSGALSILATIRGQWHYSATFLGGVYMGSRNRLTPLGTELERLNLPLPLFKQIEKTYVYLKG